MWGAGKESAKCVMGTWERLAKMNQRAKCLGIRAAIEDFTFILQASWALHSARATFILFLIVQLSLWMLPGEQING